MHIPETINFYLHPSNFKIHTYFFRLLYFFTLLFVLPPIIILLAGEIINELVREPKSTVLVHILLLFVGIALMVFIIDRLYSIYRIVNSQFQIEPYLTLNNQGIIFHDRSWFYNEHHFISWNEIDLVFDSSFRLRGNRITSISIYLKNSALIKSTISITKTLNQDSYYVTYIINKFLIRAQKSKQEMIDIIVRIIERNVQLGHLLYHAFSNELEFTWCHFCKGPIQKLNPEKS